MIGAAATRLSWACALRSILSRNSQAAKLSSSAWTVKGAHRPHGPGSHRSLATGDSLALNGGDPPAGVDGVSGFRRLGHLAQLCGFCTA